MNVNDQRYYLYAGVCLGTSWVMVSFLANTILQYVLFSSVATLTIKYLFQILFRIRISWQEAGMTYLLALAIETVALLAAFLMGYWS